MYALVHQCLNVQQEQVLSELYAHIHQKGPPSDKVHVEATLNYLEACNRLFERDFLSHDRVMSKDSEVIQNITQGFKFFFPHGSMELSRKVWNLFYVPIIL